MVKCSIIGCWNMAPNRTGLCTQHRIESPLERAKRLHRPMVDVDELAGIEREGINQAHRDRVLAEIAVRTGE